MRIDTDWLWETTETQLITRCQTGFAHYYRYPTDLVIIGRDKGAKVFDMIEYHCENGTFSHEETVNFTIGISSLGHPENPAESERRLGLLVTEWTDKHRCCEEWGERKANVFNLSRGWNANPMSPAHVLALVHYARLQGVFISDPNIPEYLKERLGGLIKQSLIEWDKARMLTG